MHVARIARDGSTAAAVIALLGIPSCTREPTVVLPSVTNYIVAVALASDPNIKGALVGGQPPNLSSTGGLTITAPPAVINGGSAQVQLSRATAFQTVIVLVSGRPDYYALNLPAAQTSVDLIITLSTRLNGSFQWQYGVGASAASAGDYTAAAVSFVRVLSGDVQVSIAWDSPADVDLHVIEPGAEEIYYGNPRSTAGGVLDLDSNAACGSDGPRNENITYPGVTPPSGTYTVRVDYWDSCAATETRYVVTVLVRDRPPQTYTGTFTGSGDAGGAGSGVTVGSFMFP